MHGCTRSAPSWEQNDRDDAESEAMQLKQGVFPLAYCKVYDSFSVTMVKAPWRQGQQVAGCLFCRHKYVTMFSGPNCEEENRRKLVILHGTNKRKI